MQTAEVPRILRGKNFPRFVSLLASAALLAGGIWVMGHRVDWRQAVSVWIDLNPWFVAAAMVLYWLQYPMAAIRLQRVIFWAAGCPPHQVPSLKLLLRLTFSSAFVAVAAPISLAGDAAKVAGLRLFTDLSITLGARCVLFDRVVGVQWLSVVGLATLPFQFALGISQPTILLELAAFCAMLVAIVAFIFLPRFLSLLRYKIFGHMARVVTGYGSLLYPDRSAIQLAIGLINMTLAWGSLYLLMRAAHLETNAWVVGGFIPLLQLVNGLPFLYMGWGGRELAMTATLGAAGNFTISQLLAVSIAWGVVVVVTAAVNGIFLLGSWRLTRRETGRSSP